MDEASNHLRDYRILVAEDEASIAVMIEGALSEIGCQVYIAQTLSDAIEVATTKPIDCALLDLRLGDDAVFSVADILAANRIPFIFSSGYGKDALPSRYCASDILAKPYSFHEVVSALATALRAGSSRAIDSSPQGGSDCETQVFVSGLRVSGNSI